MIQIHKPSKVYDGFNELEKAICYAVLGNEPKDMKSLLVIDHNFIKTYEDDDIDPENISNSRDIDEIGSFIQNFVPLSYVTLYNRNDGPILQNYIEQYDNVHAICYLSNHHWVCIKDGGYIGNTEDTDSHVQFVWKIKR